MQVTEKKNWLTLLSRFFLFASNLTEAATGGVPQNKVFLEIS